MHTLKLPVPEKQMEREGNNDTNSICQVLRQIYELSDDSMVKLKCRVATAMAKAMLEKLQEYKSMELK